MATFRDVLSVGTMGPAGPNPSAALELAKAAAEAALQGRVLDVATRRQELELVEIEQRLKQSREADLRALIGGSAPNGLSGEAAIRLEQTKQEGLLRMRELEMRDADQRAKNEQALLAYQERTAVMREMASGAERLLPVVVQAFVQNMTPGGQAAAAAAMPKAAEQPALAAVPQHDPPLPRHPQAACPWCGMAGIVPPGTPTITCTRCKKGSLVGVPDGAGYRCPADGSPVAAIPSGPGGICPTCRLHLALPTFPGAILGPDGRPAQVTHPHANGAGAQPGVSVGLPSPSARPQHMGLPAF